MRMRTKLGTLTVTAKIQEFMEPTVYKMTIRTMKTSSRGILDWQAWEA